MERFSDRFPRSVCRKAGFGRNSTNSVTSHVPISIFFPVGFGFSRRDSTVVRPLGILWARFVWKLGYDVFSLTAAAAGPASSVSNAFQSCLSAVSASSSGSPGPPRLSRFGNSRKYSAGSCASAGRAPAGCGCRNRGVAREEQRLLPEVQHADCEIAALAPSPLARRVQRRQRVAVGDSSREVVAALPAARLVRA